MLEVIISDRISFSLCKLIFSSIVNVNSKENISYFHTTYSMQACLTLQKIIGYIKFMRIWLFPIFIWLLGMMANAPFQAYHTQILSTIFFIISNA